MGLELLFWLVAEFYVSAVAVGLLGFFMGPLFFPCRYRRLDEATAKTPTCQRYRLRCIHWWLRRRSFSRSQLVHSVNNTVSRHCSL